MAIFKKDTSALCLVGLMIMATVLSSSGMGDDSNGCFLPMPIKSCHMDVCKQNCRDSTPYCKHLGVAASQCCCTITPNVPPSSEHDASEDN